MSDFPIALQMYTVRDEAAKDFTGTLKQVAGIGYKAIELAGMHKLSATALKAVLDDLGLKVIGNHVPMQDLENNLSRVFDENHTLANKYIVMPWLPEERRKTAQDWIALAQSLNAIGAKCQTEGFQLCYHNHDFEFQTFGGQVAYDLIFSRVDPKNVHTEIDVYWVRYAGKDAVAMIRRFAGRVPLIHIKDMTKATPHTFAEIGEGIIDFKPIFEVSQSSGVQWYVVEQDACNRPALESIRISWRNLQRLIP
jgi:sugar phosphate isomerase/epimerase